jgi:hypothetical protein
MLKHPTDFGPEVQVTLPPSLNLCAEESFSFTVKNIKGASLLQPSMAYHYFSRHSLVF